MLITAITGKEVPSGGLPMDVGCVVQNIGSLVAIAEAFYEGKPLIERGLNGNWGACKTPKNILAPIGTILTNLEASFMEIDQDKLRKVIFGGPMMGTRSPPSIFRFKKHLRYNPHDLQRNQRIDGRNLHPLWPMYPSLFVPPFSGGYE